MSASRCRVCGGKGEVALDDDEAALQEWIEGYLDPETDDKWLEQQMRRLLDIRNGVIKSPPDPELDEEDDD